MKKLIVASALALAVTVVGQQRASAWSEGHISIGLSASWAGGDNCLLWGLRRSGPWPGTCSGLPSYQVVPHYQAAPYSGGPSYGGFDFAPPVAPPAWEAPAPSHAQAFPSVPATPVSASPYFYSGFQPVNYYAGYYQAPAYWYGH